VHEKVKHDEYTELKATYVITLRQAYVTAYVTHVARETGITVSVKNSCNRKWDCREVHKRM